MKVYRQTPNGYEYVNYKQWENEQMKKRAPKMWKFLNGLEECENNHQQ